MNTRNRNGQTPAATGVCQCAKACEICECNNTKKQTQNQAIGDYKERIQAAPLHKKGGRR